MEPLMTLNEAIKRRHSVRQYLDDPIPQPIIDDLCDLMNTLNERCDLSIQLITDEPHAFENPLARYGHFDNVRNYFTVIGRRGLRLYERAGYAGEALVLRAQQLGLNSCWVGLSYKKSAVPCWIKKNEKLTSVIALGYGANSGKPHPVKPLEKLCSVQGDQEMPVWFLQGIEAAQLAPTAINQQKFHFELLAPDGSQRPRVKASAKSGPYSDLDLGIAAYHFQMAAGADNFQWAQR